MVDTRTHQGPPRGRPRSERSRQAILQATAALLLEKNLDAISLDAVAERAGTSKATIYRWWPSKGGLALDALLAEWEPESGDCVDTGALKDDLAALILPWTRRLVERPYGRVIAALIARAQSDPEFAREYRARFTTPRRERARIALRRAAERGEIRADVDEDVVLDLLYGPIYHRLLHTHAPLTVGFAATVIDHVVAAAARPQS